MFEVLELRFEVVESNIESLSEENTSDFGVVYDSKLEISTHHSHSIFWLKFLFQKYSYPDQVEGESDSDGIVSKSFSKNVVFQVVSDSPNSVCVVAVYHR